MRQYIFKSKIQHGLTGLLLLLLAISIIGCGGGGSGDSSSGGDSGSGSSTNGSTTTILVSSSLAENGGNGTMRSIARGLSTNCSSSEAAACITPSQVSGKAYYAGIFVGTQLGYSVGPILGNIKDPSQATSFQQSELYDFDLSTGIQTPGSPVCCGGSPYPADEEAFVTSFHVYFGYIDSTFTLDESDGVSAELQGTHTIRLVYGDVEGTDLEQGDLLYQGASDTTFKWCTTESGCIHETRPENPIQHFEISRYSAEQEDTPGLPSITAELAEGHSSIQLTEASMLDVTKKRVFTVDVHMDNGIFFKVDPQTMGSISELVAAFELSAETSRQATGFSVNITMTESDATPEEIQAAEAANSNEGEEPSPLDLNQDGTIDVDFGEETVLFQSTIESVQLVSGDGSLSENTYTFSTFTRAEFVVQLTSGEQYQLVIDPSIDELEEAIQYTQI